MTMESLPQFEEVNIQKYLEVIQRRWLPLVGIFSIALSFGCLYAFSQKPSYKAEGSLMIKTNRSSSLTGLPDDIGRLEALNINDNPLETQVRVIGSNPVIDRTINTLNLKDKKGKMLSIRDLATQLKIEGIKGTDVVQISYKNNDPELAAKIVNEVIKSYIDLNIQANQDEARTAKGVLVTEVPKAEEVVRRAESKLRVFKEQNKVVVLQQEATAAVDTISKLGNQISQAQAQLDDVKGRLQQLGSEAQLDSRQGVIASDLSQAPGVQKVLIQLQETESQLAIERTRFSPEHPTITSLEEKVVALKNLLKERTGQVAGTAQITEGSLQLGQLRQSLIADITRAQAERVGLERQIATLLRQQDAFIKRANNLPRLEQTQRELERKLQAAQTTYETLLKKRQEIDIAQNQKIANARVISLALVPDKAEGPRKILFIVGGGAVGLFLGIIVAFSLDLIDRSVKTVKEAKEVLKYTVLGVIPTQSKNPKAHSSIAGIDRPIPKIIGRDIPYFPLGNAYQILQVNLKFLRSDKPLKSIVITSSVGKEGKSDVSANLAVTMAQAGRRVLLVDADMRNPIQHHVWGLNNTDGLSNVIVGQVSLDAVVQEVMPNLEVLTSGVLPPNPVALLDSQRMATLISNFTRDYDLVIFDTPPLSGIADAAVLSTLTDGILLVVRPGVVDLNSANAAKEFLNQSGQKVLGIVINGVNIKNESNNYLPESKKREIKEDLVSSSLTKFTKEH
ncbi:polysaccharide biosynthesis tyrosine autokinase [Nostoc sp. UCD121]|uniref:GumC family protein n=1 Tax=unclassified Nostoc TaxID=2593658 RepID=UPI00162A4211|nr:MULTISPECIES: polysaccharide biosynthesis tyrosine autokinase [unclassified Nostoc]MBC1220172.1 polysaccharide biosynthesis tyrosine autokinase [Nostoc sp. UCD120]MBC1276503.1 polysaccharide biosynthesis tyrosine autokinase [Nostoc sp. UCD121]MBC1299551.1 polysaccharide biosynthesis tyrosine autokinase [Nostoc sp. UCD122]